MYKNLPKVLVVNINAWRDNSGIHTYQNLFKHWDKEKLAQIYCRSALPSTDICDKFFQIPEKSVLLSIFKRGITVGKTVENEPVSETASESQKSDTSFYSFFRKHRSSLFELFRESIWLFGRWKTSALDAFIDDFEPDVIFVPIYPYTFVTRVQNYVIRHAKKPVVTYMADDAYSYKPQKGNLGFYINRFFLRKQVKQLVRQSNQNLVIAPKLKEEFDKIFGIDSKLLTKGIDFSSNTNPTVDTLNKPIQLVYTGKTYIGRWKSLSKIAECIEKINSEQQNMFLSIYTTETLSDKVLKALNRPGASQVMGAVTHDEVMKIQQKSDIVVFVESLQWKHKDAARMSFSTKITDYFENGKCILAVGSREVAPIDYLIKEDAALVATSYKEIETVLNSISSNSDLVKQYASKSYECGKRNHSSELIKNTLIGTISEVAKQEYKL